MGYYTQYIAFGLLLILTVVIIKTMVKDIKFSNNLISFGEQLQDTIDMTSKYILLSIDNSGKGVSILMCLYSERNKEDSKLFKIKHIPFENKVIYSDQNGVETHTMFTSSPKEISKVDGVICEIVERITLRGHQ